MRLAEAPSFARDGSLVTEPGYHPAGQVYVWGDVPQVSVPQKPSGKDIAAARATLETELLGDFPLTGESERAHAVALLLQLFVRDLIDGPTPLYLVEKPAPGSGATLLVDAITRVATGRGLLTMTAGRDDDEMRKRISAKLYAAPPYVLFDNVRVRLDAGALAAAITATSWEDRPLGTSQTRSVPVRCAWIATGNNPQVSDEIARRTVRLRLDAKVDRPWMRRPETFRHPRLREWVDEHRRELIGAVLTLGQAWLVAGRPYDGATLGMFESWSNVIGGILQVAGVPGFLGNLDEFYEDADEEGAAWREFVAAWWEQHGDREVEVRELFTLADRLLDLGRGEEKPRHNRLGLLLREARDRQYDELRIVRAGLSRGVRRWRVVEVQA